ncbi:hypothetical protein [Variovorax sp. J31P207]|nr:hypothetical protein [Variovorax sp. J31P207]MDM0072486.1 hypothetical protein [Variovorax sp. J31P207]
MDMPAHQLSMSILMTPDTESNLGPDLLIAHYTVGNEQDRHHPAAHQ